MSVRLSRVALYATLTGFAVCYLLPVYVVLTTSFKPMAEATLDKMWVLPSTLQVESYRVAFEKLWPHFLNTVYLVVPATVLTALIGSLNGYLLSKWRFRGANAVFALLLFGMFIPYQSILIPLIQFLQAIGLYNTLAGLVLVHVVYGIPIATLIFRNFFVAVPDDIIEAARVDGAGVIRIYWRILLPLAIPGFVVVGIWEFTAIWNEFLFAVTITTAKQQPIMVALQNLSGSQIVQWNVQMAGALLAALPTVLVYILMGRYFVRGLLAGSIK